MYLQKKTILTVISLIFVGCSHYVVNQVGYIRPPQKYTFKYKKNATALTSIDIIDTTVIYYLHNSNYYRNDDKYKNGDSYIRFYSDGRLKRQGIAEFPKIEDINDVNKGSVGYYLLKGKLIKIQIYSDISGGSDQLEFGLIDDNKDLVILNENPRSSINIGKQEESIKNRIEKSYFNPKIYKKTKVSGIIYIKPNW